MQCAKNNKTTASIDYERCLYRTPLIGVLKLYTRLIIAVLFHHIKDINNIPYRQIILQIIKRELEKVCYNYMITYIKSNKIN